MWKSHGVSSATASILNHIEDQQRINTFSKLNNRLSDIQDQLKVKQVSCQHDDSFKAKSKVSLPTGPLRKKRTITMTFRPSWS